MVQDLDHEPVTRIEDELVAADHEQDGMGTKSFRSMDICYISVRDGRTYAVRGRRTRTRSG